MKVRVGVKVSAWHIELAAPGGTPAFGPAHAVSLEAGYSPAAEYSAARLFIFKSFYP